MVDNVDNKTLKYISTPKPKQAKSDVAEQIRKIRARCDPHKKTRRLRDSDKK